MSTILDLPRELLDQILAYLTIGDRLVLRAVCRKLQCAIAAPDPLLKADVNHVADRLSHDRYQVLCRQYRAGMTEKGQMPCARCRQLHPIVDFFSDQLIRSDDERCCKRHAAIPVCACTHVTWRHLTSFTASGDTAHGDTAHGDTPHSLDCRGRGPDGASSCYVTLKHRFRHDKWKSLLPLCVIEVLPGYLRPETVLQLQWRLRVPPLFHQGGEQNIVVDVLRTTPLQICPHLSTSDIYDAQSRPKSFFELMLANGNNRQRRPDAWVKFNRYYEEVQGSCRERKCTTRYFFKRDLDDDYIKMIITKNFGVLDTSRGPMQNEAWLAQVSSPLPGSKSPALWKYP